MSWTPRCMTRHQRRRPQLTAPRPGIGFARPNRSKRGVTLTVVPGDMIEGTIIVRLLHRRDPDAVAACAPTAPYTPFKNSPRSVIVRSPGS